jgi:hypothetical protein
MFGECMLRLPNAVGPRVGLAAACAQVGWLEKAGKEAAEVLRIYPGFTIESWKPTLPWRAPKDAEHLVDGLHKAGFRET